MGGEGGDRNRDRERDIETESDFLMTNASLLCPSSIGARSESQRRRFLQLAAPIPLHAFFAVAAPSRRLHRHGPRAAARSQEEAGHFGYAHLVGLRFGSKVCLFSP